MSLSRQQRRAAERAARKAARKGATNSNATTLTTENGELTTTSEARLSANRANAERSTGPRTQEGRAISSQNSFKHGLYSKQLVVKGEDPAELDALKADLIAEHQPGNLTEAILVNEMAEHYWRLKRYRRLEAILMEGEVFVLSQMTAVQRFMNAAERGFHKSLKALRDMQKVRGFVPTQSASTKPETEPGSVSARVNHGFVSPKPAETEPLLDDDAAFKAECEMFEAYLKAA